MQCTKFKIIASFLLYVFIFQFLNANESQEKILLKDRLEIFNLDKKKVEEESSILEKEWINQLIYRLTKEYKEDYNNLQSTISISQPIFKSGGIYRAIKYAKASKEYENLDIVLKKSAMIKDALSFLFKIKKQTILIEKQNLLIENATIDVQRKKEQVLNGIINTSYLDNAILYRNDKKNTLLELNFEKLSLITNFSNLSDIKYKEVKLPILSTIIDTDYFLKNNLNILKMTSNIEKKYQIKGISKSQYLPTINLTYDYLKTHDSNKNNSNINTDGSKYGLNITIPLDINTFNTIERANIDYLKSKISLKNIIMEEKKFLKLQRAKIKLFDSKITLAKNNFNLYNSLLEDMSLSFKAGLNTKSDLNILENSKKIQSFDIKIFQIEKQIILLNIYARIK